MQILTEAIKVELVRPWWDHLFPVVAIFVSIGTLIYTVWERRRNAARLKVEERGFTSLPQLDGTYMHLAVTNKGRSESTVVTEAILLVPSDYRRKTIEQIFEPESEQVLPIRLEPGDSVNLYFDADEMRKELEGTDLALNKFRLSRSRLDVVAGHHNFKYKLSIFSREYLLKTSLSRWPLSRRLRDRMA